MRWANKVNFDCLLFRQHLCQKLPQSNHVCEDDSKWKVGRFWDTVHTSFNKMYSLISETLKFKTLNLKTSVSNNVNARWLLNKVPVASIGGGAEMKSENVLITESIDSMYFIVVLRAAVNSLKTGPQWLAELMPLKLRQQIGSNDTLLTFLWMLFPKENRVLLKF